MVGLLEHYSSAPNQKNVVLWRLNHTLCDRERGDEQKIVSELS